MVWFGEDKHEGLHTYRSRGLCAAGAGSAGERVGATDDADGAVVGTTFNVDGKFENHIDLERVKAFMNKVKAFR